MIGRRCPAPPARRDGGGQLRSHFTSADLPRLRQVALDLVATATVDSVIAMPPVGTKPMGKNGAWPTAAISKAPRGGSIIGPSARVSSAPSARAKKRDGSIFPLFRSLPQDARGRTPRALRHGSLVGFAASFAADDGDSNGASPRGGQLTS
jgi:hypothetical protein